MRYIFILLALLCASCGTALPTIKPYKLDVQQGNVVTSKMLLQLRPGMTKSQVRFIMGTPLIQDSFHGNRWDYVYQMREAGKIKEQRRVILDFESELLKSVRGDVIPAGNEQGKADEAQAPTGTRVVTPVKKPEDKGILNKLKFWEKDEAELAKEAAEKEAAAKAKLEADEAARNAAAAKQRKEAPAAEEPKSLLAVPIEVPAVSAPAQLDNVKPAGDAAPSATVIEPAIIEVVPTEPKSAKSRAVAKPHSAVPSAEAVSPVPETAVAPAVVEIQPTERVSPKAKAHVKPVSDEASHKPETIEPEVPPTDSPRYQSPSGMVFDRKLQTGLEEPESVVEPISAGPRTGNKEIPKPKELPQESDPSFFDRMLEQIGF